MSPAVRRQASSALRRAIAGALSLAIVLLVLASCMGESTGPSQASRITAPVRFSTRFPELQRNSLFADIVPFTRVHVVLKRGDGSVAVDTLVDFPSTASQITLSLSVKLSAGASASGESMTLELSYLTAQGEEVFHGGSPITVVPDLPGQPAPPPVEIDVVYTGVGANATAVKISPRSLNASTGGDFAFTAVATDAAGVVVPNTPIAWTSLDAARATITNVAAGAGKAQSQRGAARIVAQLLNGKADTVIVNVQPLPTAIAAVSGSGQSAKVGKAAAPTLAQPLVAKVTAGDGLGVSGVTVTFAAQNGGTVSPATAVTDANGLAQTSWTLGNSAGAQTATASATGLSGSPITYTATGQAITPTKLAITSAPAAGASINSQSPFNIVVAAQDADGDVATSFTGTVSLAISGGPAGGTIAGPTSVAAINGVATFTAVSISAPGTGYVIGASSAGLSSASTPAFNIINGPAASLALVSGGSQSSTPGSQLSPIVVVVKDAANTPKAGVTVSFAVSSGGGSVTPIATSTDANGQATATWTLGPNSGAQTLSASTQGVAPLSVSATAISLVNQLAFTQQPAASQSVATPLTPAIKVEVRSPAGALLANYSGAVTIALGTNTAGATLGGTATVNASGGVATFSNLTLDKAGTGYTLVASTPGATNATSTAFTIAGPPATTLTLASGNNQTGSAGAALAQPIVAKVSDANGVGVAGVTVTFAVTGGGGSVTPTTATTNTSGLASTSWTLGSTGAQSISITSGSLAGSPLTATASIAVTGGGAAASTLVTPHLDTITALTDIRSIAAQARDAAGNVVAGSWTWVSRSPSVATVNANGVVTAVADGSTIIVATEANGSKDSATVVVQQRIATINVSPTNRSIYTGGTFTFTAQAVDGRGVPMVVQPTFAWSSTNAQAASVNASTGVATGLQIGSTQIRATSGTTIGVANLTILSPITRIDVSYDSTNAIAPDVFTLTALGDTRSYRAIARDTLLNVINGVSFTWSSSNASVALIDQSTATTARAVAAANGVTTIRATAQGVTGGATLNVTQGLASIELTPVNATVGIGGTTSMTARGKDANNRYITGGSFAFATSAASVATVNATTGVVTGVASGTANITASAGNIVSNAAVITVSNTGPALISFGRDTLGIGRGTSLSVPIYLSRPNAAPVTVTLAVADTFAFWSAASVVIPAGQTSTNAQLNGRNAGTTRITALDGSGTGFTGDTAVLAVQATLRLTSSSYSVSATDQAATQVLLSDPSPAGGTYVTFSYGTAGRAQVSPDPAFIPAGQLAADIVIKGLVAGSTTVTPNATGVNGTASSVTVGAAVLTLSGTQVRLGTGQFEPNVYVQAPNNLNNGLSVTISSTDTTVARARTSPIMIPAGSYYQYFDGIATGPGTAKLIASAAGWQPDTITFITTTPLIRVAGGGALNTTSNPTYYTVYAADSTRNVHQRVSSLAVRLSSSNPAVLQVLDTLVTIAPGQTAENGQVIPGGATGTAWLKATAGGHTPDSTLYTVSGPKLSLSYATHRLGAGQEERSVYVQVPNSVSQSLAVTLTSSDSSIAAAPQVITIGAGSTYEYFTIRGKAAGSATIIASAVGYSPDTGTTVVTTPRVRFGSQTRNLNAYSTSGDYIYTADSTRAIHYTTQTVRAQVVSLDTTIAKVDSVAIIAAGQQNSEFMVITAVNPGTTKLVVTAPGHTPDTSTVTVLATKLSLSWTTYTIGARQTQLGNAFYVATPNARSVSVPVTLTQKRPNTVGLSTTSVTIPADNNVGYFTFSGLTTGRDTIIATAPGYAPDTGFVNVSTPRLRANGIPATANTTSPPYTVFLFTADSLNSSHYSSDTLVIKAVSSDTNVIKPGENYFRINKNEYYAQPTIVYRGSGTANITYSDSAGTGYQPFTTNNVTVTGPSLTVSGGSGKLGMRQQSTSSEYYVQVANSVSQDLTVNLVSTDPRVVTVPATVVIPAGSYYAYFPVVAKDTTGTIQIQATATGYTVGTRNVQVTQARFRISTTSQLNTTSPRYPITVYATDDNDNVHLVTEDVIVTLQSSAPGIAAIDSATVTIKSGTYYSQAATWSPVSPGNAVLTASDSRSASNPAPRYAYVSDVANVTVVTPTAYFGQSQNDMAIGQYYDMYVAVPDNVTSPLTIPLNHSAVPHVNTPASVVIPAGQSYVYFRVTGTSLGKDTLTAAPAGHVAAKHIATVGQGRFDPLGGWPSSIKVGDSVQVAIYTRDPTQNQKSVAANTTLTLSTNANIRFVSGGAQSATITSVVVPADDNYVYVWVKGVTAGTGSVSISSPNYTTYSTTVTVNP